MGFRVVLIESEAKVSLKLNNLIVNKGEGDIWIPIDDISMIIIDNLQVTLTARMLSVIAEHNVGIVISDQKHNPIGLYSSYDNHSRISKTVKYQIETTKEKYDEIWKFIIKNKIDNQKKVIQRIKPIDEIIREMECFKNEVENGDPTNREAHAAKVYFNTLMDSSFSRGNEEILLNSGLDYGYAIIRSYIARICVGYGLNTQLGMHHRSEYNRFNLADDLIEPLRAFVDLYAYSILEDAEFFMPEHRHKLVNMLNHKVYYNSKNMYLCNMIEEYVEQYASYLSGNRDRIEIPDIDGYTIPNENYLLGEEDEL